MGEDYIRRGALGALFVVISLIALGAVPAYSVGGVTLRRINILSQILDSPSSKEVVEEVELEIDEEEYKVDLEVAAREAAAARDMMSLKVSDVAGGGGAPQRAVSVKELPELTHDTMIKSSKERILSDDIELTPIESFDMEQGGGLDRFYHSLSTRGATTRIAVLGDSFIEGDILTADLREGMQLRYGGSGAGFTPLSSPLTKFRRTIKTESEGWRSYNIMQRTKAPEKYASMWAVSGWICEPAADGASVRWECTDNREKLSSCQRVRILFVSRQASDISVVVNGGEAQRFHFEGSERVEQIELERECITSCEMKVESGASGFVGYGAFFEGRGVVVDNYSIRSNNGQAMLWTNSAINAQIDALVGGYDMVILQYGLNILQRGVKNYTAYSEQIEKMIAFARLCFPRAAVVVMGVSDRSMRDNGHYEPIVECSDMIRYQREAAERSGATFWNTHAAMGRRGGMAKFVERGWAGKDFTHINFLGGREIGRALAEAINVARRAAYPPMIEKQKIDPLTNYEDLEALEAQSLLRDEALEREMINRVEPRGKRGGVKGIW